MMPGIAWGVTQQPAEQARKSARYGMLASLPVGGPVWWLPRAATKGPHPPTGSCAATERKRPINRFAIVYEVCPNRMGA